MRTFVISDIHGCFRELVELLGKMRADLRQDKLIMLGDYIDRGPQSYEVIKHVMALQKEFGAGQVILLKGNHEQMAVDFYRTGDKLWHYNGNEPTFASFRNNQDDLRHYLGFLSELPLIYQDEYMIYVHAGINPDYRLEDQKAGDLLNIRQQFYLSRKRFPKIIVFGHTPTLSLTRKDYPLILADRIGIDTGCVYGGSLSGLEIREGQVNDVFQVKRLAGLP